MFLRRCLQTNNAKFHTMANSTKILPHINSETDGFGSAYAAWTRLGNKATYYPAVHYSPPPTDIKDKNVALFDFSYARNVLTEIEKQAKSVIVVDHHKTARDNLLGDDSSPNENKKNYFFDMDKSGARLAWEFFWPNKEVPLFIRYIEDKDLFRFDLPNSKEFSISWSIIPMEFEIYDKYAKDEKLVKKAIESGSHIIEYTNHRMAHLQKNDSFKRKMTVQSKTYTVYALNSIVWQSELGNILVNKDDADLGMIFSYEGNKKRFRISLRSLDEKADVSQIAKAFGGGGHRNAAGFSWEKDIESLFDPE
ncbi:5930_t:CDS:2 [Diversispora eburnea]|uniref:5930_t:CDS:1 n=1 Tax=Diversispora eburnea TaxID=1213867 RepID=A0A9N8WDE1_9GLOM|nr:5930_t:CDS:2 [Diversispora eburnea]